MPVIPRPRVAQLLRQSCPQTCNGNLQGRSLPLLRIAGQPLCNLRQYSAVAAPRQDDRIPEYHDNARSAPEAPPSDREAPQEKHWPRLAALRVAIAAETAATQFSPTTFPPASSTAGHAPNPTPRNAVTAAVAATATPFSPFLTDTFGRQHTYLRISLTERCNLRCTYCMPAGGIPLSPEPTQLTTPEILALASLFVHQGVTKIRLTGGEPTVRRDFVALVQELGKLHASGLRELCITSNGLALRSKLGALAAAGLTGVNLSLDTLQPEVFEAMTRRRGFEKVVASMERILEMNRTGAGIKLKVNVVVMRGVNNSEILDFVELGRHKDLEVRFIEYMPFDGNRWARQKMFSYAEMLARIQEAHPGLQRVPDASGSETSKTWQVDGFAGRVGFITSMTDNFCAGCNRLRVTSDGNLKVCLFGDAEVSLRDLLRKSNAGVPIDAKTWEVMQAAEQATRGNALGEERESELLQVIGAAVGRKKARHAGMGALENMKNRPMILIDNLRLNARKSTWPHTTRTRKTVPVHLLGSPNVSNLRCHSTKSTASDPGPVASHDREVRTVQAQSSPARRTAPSKAATSLPHLTPTSEIHVVSISSKAVSHRTATATASLAFSNPAPLPLVRSASLKKGDVLAVARVAGVMAAKRTSDIIPLCHSGVSIEGIRVWAEVVGAIEGSKEGSKDTGMAEPSADIDAPLSSFLNAPIGRYGGIRLAATVECSDKTGVEMEALCAVAGAGLSALDMVKGVDKGCVLGEIQAVRKSGGRSGDWRAEGW